MSIDRIEILCYYARKVSKTENFSKGSEKMLREKQRDPIAEAIKDTISEKGLVQKAVARRAGFTEQQFSDMMTGRKIIRACDLGTIAKALGVEVAELYAAGQRGA